MALKFNYEIHANAFMDQQINVYKYSFKTDKEAIKKGIEFFTLNRLYYICKVLNEANKIKIYTNQFYKPITKNEKTKK
jgi:hypothetical protein